MMKWHYNILQEFNKEYYHGIITPNMLQEEITIKGKYYWVFNYKKQKWLLNHDLTRELPIKILSDELLPYRNKLYHVIKEYKSVRIKPEKHFSFKELVDNINLNHSNPEDYKLFKILALASVVGRINFRACSEAGFGKDSVFSILSFLTNNVSIINPRTAPAVEYRLLNKVLVLNELSNLESNQRDLLQEILLLIGDYKNVYEKSSRATGDTKDEYDISKLSLVILYNNKNYYDVIGKTNKFFDNLFTEAIKDRFIPFKFDGRLDMTQFNINLNQKKIKELISENKDFYVRMVRSIEWYKQNYVQELENKEDWKFKLGKTLLRGRHILLFNKISDFLKLYANDKEEYYLLLGQAYYSYKKYLKMINNQQTIFGNYEITKPPDWKEEELTD